MYEVFVLIVGLVWGSFLNVTATRDKKTERSILGRSFCDSCKHTLSWYDLVPIISLATLRGKCRYCKTKIPIKNSINEFISGIFFLLIGVYFLDSESSVLVLIILGLVFFTLTYLSSYDLWWQEIPLVASVISVVLAVVYKIVYIFTSADYSFYWLLSLSFPILLIILINKAYHRQAFGAGDYLIVAVLGISLKPLELFVAMEAAILSGALIGVLFALKIGKLKGVTIPLVPFLVFGWLVALNFTDFFVEFFTHGFFY